MKTAEKMAKEFSEKFKFNEYFQYELEKLLDKMELQTRHACIEEINKKQPFRVSKYDVGLAYSEVHAAIMNTKELNHENSGKKSNRNC